MDVFNEKTVVVTGAAAGIGKALCLALGRRGAFVIAAGHHLDRVERTAREVRDQGGAATAAQVDVTREEDVKKIIDRTVQEYGRLDYYFNNAGISIAGEMRDLSLDDWRRVLDVNFMGVLYGSHYAYMVMASQGRGHIVNVSSLGGLLPFPVKGPYSASKHAVVGLTSTLRAEAARLGVKISLVCPGLIATEIWEKTPIHKADNKAVKNIFTLPMLPVNKAAEFTLKGVARNKGIIVFPFHAKLAWRAYRLSPALLTPMGWYMMRSFRKIRKDQA
ncbi:Short-chain dehydrogenase [Desulfatibacillum alkenivorans DSM 16219]|jgi:NAD(P)-dependent dehydrogenase (short-subunit alcohol dehydrogenase family)|uniref:Short-chain dehydrogenase n=1 Tax=Desulfatibacillum alkenivorans DSM 16219 TaxID=1121393 RepID=A0A1M6X7A7_9BACT|nr:SDR family oxidoreductase [Desulfatibacillum alkenivorans]SHL01665.1 Short-chain dehydrogenase [Desulfatibacillum alkenivorans DSM 16219]